jgi:DNA-binding IclR family transcriptional regulator
MSAEPDRQGTDRPDKDNSRRDPHGIQSVDIAMTVLRALAAARAPQSLKKLAELCRMSPSKLHRYLHSLIKAGMVVQLRRNGDYELGPLSLQIGFAALQRNDLVNHAADHLQQLAFDTDSPACLSVFSTGGPTIIRWQHGNVPIGPLFAVGQTLPLVTSATGNVFLAFLPRHETQALLEQERSRVQDPSRYDDAAIDELVRRVRASGHAVSHAGVVPDQTAVSAPILNWQDEASAAVTVVTRRDASAVECSTRHLMAFCSSNSLRRLT